MSGGSQAAIQELAERIGQADAIVIGASNGLSITEGSAPVRGQRGL